MIFPRGVMVCFATDLNVLVVGVTGGGSLYSDLSVVMLIALMELPESISAVHNFL